MGKKHGGLRWKPPTDRKCQHWPDTYLKGGKRQKSPQGKGFEKSPVMQVIGPVSIRPCSQRDNGHGYYGGMFITHGRPEKFKVFQRKCGNWTPYSEVDAEVASTMCKDFGVSLPDWNEEVELVEGMMKIKPVGVEK